MSAIETNNNFSTINRNMSVPVKSPYSIVGSCNGLLMLCMEFNPAAKFALWNPATDEFGWVPMFNLRSPFSCNVLTRRVSTCESFRFGFDAIATGDYKLVKFASFYNKHWGYEDQVIWENLKVKAVVFSWKTWSWKVVKDDGIPAAYYAHPVAANNHLYWAGTRSSSSSRDFGV
ncbi:hypothetical protein LINGRAHAP2_LOCUS14868 [Linum grandiflorum]